MWWSIANVIFIVFVSVTVIIATHTPENRKKKRFFRNELDYISSIAIAVILNGIIFMLEKKDLYMFIIADVASLMTFTSLWWIQIKYTSHKKHGV